MDIRVERIWFKEKYIIGRMYVDNVFFCNTLEDVARKLPANCPYTPKGLDCKCKEKVYGETAILPGVYAATYNMSAKLGRKLILLLDTPHFRGIRIHKGKNEKWSEGCILIGKNDKVGELSNGDYYEKELGKMAEKANSIKVTIS